MVKCFWLNDKFAVVGSMEVGSNNNVRTFSPSANENFDLAHIILNPDRYLRMS